MSGVLQEKLIGRGQRLDDEVAPRVPFFIAETKQQPFGELMIDLDVAGHAVRILKFARRRVAEQSWPIDDRHAIGREGGDALARVLCERTNVQRYLVEKESYAAAHDRAAGLG